MTQEGDGLTGLLAAISLASPSTFQELEAEFCRLFQHYQGLSIEQNDEAEFAVFVRTRTQRLPLSFISDGAVYYLAYLALRYSGENTPSPLLIEEPENRVHHAALKEIIAAVRHVVDDKGVQVILTTHSPYLLNLVEPEDVRVFWKDDKGAAHAVKMSDVPEMATLKQDFMAGEIWTLFDEQQIVERVSETKKDSATP
jgi:predicted ATPase